MDKLRRTLRAVLIALDQVKGAVLRLPESIRWVIIVLIAVGIVLAALAIPNRARGQDSQCVPIEFVLLQAMLAQPGADLAETFDGDRAQAMLAVIRANVTHAEDAVADEIAVITLPEVPAFVLIGLHHGCALWRMALPAPALDELKRRAFGNAI